MKITSNKQYKQALHELYGLMNKGSDGLTEADYKAVEQMGKEIERYEDEELKIMPLPVTISGIVQDKIAELNITQAALAKMLNIGTAKLSQILNHKRKPDVQFLKAIHQKLGLDGNFILNNV